MDPTKTITPFHSLAAAIAVLGEDGNRVLRAGIKGNLVTFPAQVPTFKTVTRPDIHAKMAFLYFVRGWSMSQIADRYRMGRQRVGQIITQWRIRAVASGCVQVIDEAALIPFLQIEPDRSKSGKDTESNDSSNPGQRLIPTLATRAEAERRSDRVFESVRSPLMRNQVWPSGQLGILEELESIIEILDNQVGIRSKERFARTWEPYEQLLQRTKLLRDALCSCDPRGQSQMSGSEHVNPGRVKRAIKHAEALMRWSARAEPVRQRSPRIMFEYEEASVARVRTNRKSGQPRGQKANRVLVPFED